MEAASASMQRVPVEHSADTAPTPSSCEYPADRAEEVQRTLDLLHQQILWPMYEPVQRIRVVNGRAHSVQALVDTVYDLTYAQRE